MDLSLPLAFTIGLFSSLHCIGMCGGIIGALSYGLTDDIRERGSRFGLFLLTLSMGRVLSYALAGALLGYLGGTLMEVLEPVQGHRWLQWLAALIMVLIGLHIAGWLPKLSIIERIGVPLWKLVEPWGRGLMPVSSLPRALAYGLVWGWLPCGLVYTMLISTATKSGPVSGALYMAAFGLGTLPSVMVTGMLAGKLYHVARQPYLRIAVGLVVVVMGLASLWFPELLESSADYSHVME